MADASRDNIDAALAPIVLVSSFTLYLFTLNTRFIKVLEMEREMVARIFGGDRADTARRELDILETRARGLRFGIEVVIAATLTSCVLIIAIFAGIEANWTGAGANILFIILFSLSLVLFCAGLLALVRDVWKAMDAIWIDMPQRGSDGLFSGAVVDTVLPQSAV